MERRSDQTVTQMESSEITDEQSSLIQNVRREKVNAEEKKLKPNRFLVFCLLSAAFGAGFQMGWSLGVFNTSADVVQSFIKECFKRRDEELTQAHLDTLWSLTNGMLPFGGLFGAASCGFVADAWGRRRSLQRVNYLAILTCALSLVGRFSFMFGLVIASRFFVGIVCGLYSGLLPLYLAELSPSHLRGAIGTLNQILIVTGIVASNTLGLPDLLGTAEKWHLLLAFGLVPSLVIVLCLARAVESPKYLVKIGEHEEARKSLLKLRGNSNSNQEIVNAELNELIHESDQSNQQSEVKWAQFWNVKSLRRPLVVTIGIQISQQLCGINAVIFYSQKIFSNAGLQDSWPIYATILLGVVQFFMTIVCAYLIERAGRKFLLFMGMSGICVSSFALAIFRVVGEKYPESSDWSNIATVLAALAYIVFFSIGPGAIPWLITSELFKSDARGKATSIAVFVNWLSNFSVIFSFIFIERWIGSYSFALFGTLSMFFSAFIWFFVPETKNKSIEQIIEMFEKSFIFKMTVSSNSNRISRTHTL